MEYFVVFRDYGQLGLEAVVDPSCDRLQIITMIASRELDHIVRIDHVTADGLVHDVTSQLIDAAEAMHEVSVSA